MYNIYIDTETTGLDPIKDSIVQISGIIEKDNITIEEFDFKMSPYNNAKMSEEAEKVNGYTDGQIKTWENPKSVLNKFTDILNKYATDSKLTIHGYNVSFDIEFIKNWFRTFDVNYDKYFNNDYIDVMSMMLNYLGESFKYPRIKLTTSYKKLFKKELNNAHNALADIIATRDVYNCLKEKQEQLNLF